MPARRQVRAVDRQTGADVAPQGGQVDVGQQATAVVAQTLVGDQRASLGNCGLQAESTKRPCRVTRQVDSRTGVCPAGLLLDHVRGETALAKRSGGA